MKGSFCIGIRRQGAVTSSISDRLPHHVLHHRKDNVHLVVPSTFPSTLIVARLQIGLLACQKLICLRGLNVLVSVTPPSFSPSPPPSGLGALFVAPDLSGISDRPLKVTSVRHASTIELSEEGVEASATTAVTSMRSVSLFAVNSPFVFALVDDASLTPLFMGIVTNPAPDNTPMSNDGPQGNGTMSDQPVAEDSNKGDQLDEPEETEAAPNKTEENQPDV